jgi:hypothetical protein
LNISSREIASMSFQSISQHCSSTTNNIQSTITKAKTTTTTTTTKTTSTSNNDNNNNSNNNNIVEQMKLDISSPTFIKPSKSIEKSNNKCLLITGSTGFIGRYSKNKKKILFYILLSYSFNS